MSNSEECCGNNCHSCDVEDVKEEIQAPEISERDARINSYPGIDKKFYAEFRFKVSGKMSHYHDGLSDWLLYPSGLDTRHFKTAFDEDNMVFFDSMDELKEYVKQDTNGHCFFFGGDDQFTISLQNTDLIRRDLYKPYDKIAVRHLEEIELRFHENEMKQVLQNKPVATLQEMYEKLTGMSATEDNT